MTRVPGGALDIDRDRRFRPIILGIAEFLHGAGTPFNSVIRFRIYLTPGEFGLPTRYTHPPPTPTPHMGEHCTAEVPACTHSFLTLKQPYVPLD